MPGRACRTGLAQAAGGAAWTRRSRASADQAGLDAVVFYFPPGRCGRRKTFPREWASLRLLGVARSARGRGLSRRLTEWCIARARQQGAAEIGLHTSEAMTTARGLYERMGFVVDGDLPMNFGLRYWRFRRSLGGG